MTVTVGVESMDDYGWLLRFTSKHPEFVKKWADGKVICSATNAYLQMENIASWCNNDLHEECLFEVE